MTNLNKFAAQHLTKKQMNEVKGGRTYYCDVITDSGNKTSITVEASHPTRAIIKAGQEENVSRVIGCK